MRSQTSMGGPIVSLEIAKTVRSQRIDSRDKSRVPGTYRMALH